jgi:hypothetical protein
VRRLAGVVIELEEIAVPERPRPLTLDRAYGGKPFPPQQQIILYSSDEWEAFTHEWAHFCLKHLYLKVERFSGAGDQGIDVAGFTDDKKLDGVWDNYQCKHYDHALQPGDVWPEFGKILWYSFLKIYKAPRRYYFVAPKGVGTKLNGLLSSAGKLRDAVIVNWEKHIQKSITDTQEVPLQSNFLSYVAAFDFSIFQAKTSLEIVELHRAKCPFHAARFGGGLPERPDPPKPPDAINDQECRYIAHLLDAYADYTKKAIASVEGLKEWPKLKEHFGRQREAFYHAEGLRVFARDTVPEGTFESLQNEIYDGVIDMHDAEHPDGFARVREVTKAARSLELTSNALLLRAKTKDRDGICHQLANDDVLKWTK